MKYLIISVSILAVILGLCLLFAFLSDQYLDETEQPLLEAQDFFPSEDYLEIIPLLEEAQDSWRTHKPFFSCILSHSELDEVQYTFSRLTAYARESEMGELRSSCSELLSMLGHLRNMDRPRYYNILTALLRPNL